MGEVAYKKSKNNSTPKSTFTAKHEDHIKNLIDNNSQLFADDIIEKLTKQFQEFSISKLQLNHHAVTKKKSKDNSGKKRGVVQINDDEGIQEDVINVID
ncbi:hypothetical protein CU098_013265, partial [Rhizopus stolonifer]